MHVQYYIGMTFLVEEHTTILMSLVKLATLRLPDFLAIPSKLRICLVVCALQVITNFADLPSLHAKVYCMEVRVFALSVLIIVQYTRTCQYTSLCAACGILTFYLPGATPPKVHII